MSHIIRTESHVQGLALPYPRLQNAVLSSKVCSLNGLQFYMRSQQLQRLLVAFYKLSGLVTVLQFARFAVCYLMLCHFTSTTTRSKMGGQLSKVPAMVAYRFAVYTVCSLYCFMAGC